MNSTITGDTLKLLEQFVEYATNPNTCVALADVTYYDHEAFYRRAKQLKSQFEKSGYADRSESHPWHALHLT